MHVPFNIRTCGIREYQQDYYFQGDQFSGKPGSQRIKNWLGKMGKVRGWSGNLEREEKAREK